MSGIVKGRLLTAVIAFVAGAALAGALLAATGDLNLTGTATRGPGQPEAAPGEEQLKAQIGSHAGGPDLLAQLDRALADPDDHAAADRLVRAASAATKASVESGKPKRDEVEALLEWQATRSADLERRARDIVESTVPTETP